MPKMHPQRAMKASASSSSYVRLFIRKMFHLLCVLHLISVVTVKHSAVTALKSYTNNIASNKYSMRVNQQEMELDYTEMRGNNEWWLLLNVIFYYGFTFCCGVPFWENVTYLKNVWWRLTVGFSLELRFQGCFWLFFTQI